MVGSVLRDLRERVADRHEDDGRYYVVCARTGERPVPIAEKRFPDRTTAAEAARAATAYRAELRQYDPRLPRYDLVATEDPTVDDAADAAGTVGARRPDGRPTPTESVTDRCHDVASAVFESLSELGERTVERAVMDAYLYSAEAVGDPDDLCLVLLSTMAAELDDRLSPARQGEVLRVAADRLGTYPTGPDPVGTTLARLDACSLLDDYAVAGPTSPDADGARSRAVTLDGYALGSAGGDLSTLPLSVELLRHCPDRTVSVTDARHVADGTWRCVVTTGGGRTAGVATAVLADG